jgi:hypothetical protein
LLSLPTCPDSAKLKIFVPQLAEHGAEAARNAQESSVREPEISESRLQLQRVLQLLKQQFDFHFILTDFLNSIFLRTINFVDLSSQNFK